MAENGAADDGMMRIGKRCYVSNLAWKTSWQDLKDKFRECGTVVYANVTRGDDGVFQQQAFPPDRWMRLTRAAEPAAGRSKGWGIVEYETTDEVGSSRQQKAATTAAVCSMATYVHSRASVWSTCSSTLA
jgi:RNA recognition motif-containing protein